MDNDRQRTILEITAKTARFRKYMLRNRAVLRPKVMGSIQCIVNKVIPLSSFTNSFPDLVK